MQIQVELSDRMSKLVAEKIRLGESESPERLALTAIGRYLDDMAEIAHTDALIAESDASGPAVPISKSEFENMFAEVKAEFLREGHSLKD